MHTVPFLVHSDARQKEGTGHSLPGPVCLQGLQPAKPGQTRCSQVRPTTPLMASIQKAGGIKSLHWLTDSSGKKQICTSFLTLSSRNPLNKRSSLHGFAVYSQIGIPYTAAIFQQNLERPFSDAQEITCWSLQLWRMQQGAPTEAPTFCLDLRYELDFIPPPSPSTHVQSSPIHSAHGQYSPQKRILSERVPSSCVVRPFS
jgi:hypothetical protein